ncbi:hypothetical protein [Marinobacter aromaticivorans]|uniref:Uncharacterized protein n=1 Tax=Marinobacter aromaticivorans TaxID=1494078 RepID=A0ABW2IXZ6_9GAMM|nr:hypothetical protein [Marinobacter aromaticivorans]
MKRRAVYRKLCTVYMQKNAYFLISFIRSPERTSLAQRQTSPPTNAPIWCTFYTYAFQAQASPLKTRAEPAYNRPPHLLTVASDQNWQAPCFESSTRFLALCPAEM